MYLDFIKGYRFVKLKYYLRGLGIGIIVTTIILVSCFSMQKPKMTDEQIIEKGCTAWYDYAGTE